jgi:adenylate cyclase
LLLRRPGALVTREEIAGHLWPDSHVSVAGGLNTAVNALRQALGDSSHGARFIETRSGLGYCFIAPVEQMDDSRTAVNTSETQHNCLKGRYFLDKMMEEDARKAEAHFEAALLEDGCSALAYAGLVDTWCQFACLSMVDARTAAARAREYAILALSRDSQTAASHVAMARVRMIFDWDWKRARTEYERALEVEPRSTAAHRHYGWLLSVIDEPERAFEHLLAAQSAEPLSLPIGVEFAALLSRTGRFEEAVESCWKVLALDARFWPAQLELGIAYYKLGLCAEAQAELENAAFCSGRNPVVLGTLGYFFGGDICDELKVQIQHRHVNPLSFALAHSGLDEAPAARKWMDEAYEAHDPNLLWLNCLSIALPAITNPLKRE